MKPPSPRPVSLENRHGVSTAGTRLVRLSLLIQIAEVFPSLRAPGAAMTPPIGLTQIGRLAARLVVVAHVSARGRAIRWQVGKFARCRMSIVAQTHGQQSRGATASLAVLPPQLQLLTRLVARYVVNLGLR